MRSRLVWPLAGLGAAAILAVLAGAAYVAWLTYDVLSEDDSFRPPFSSHHAVDLVARDLCPQAPAYIENELLASWDSINYYVYVRTSPEVTSVRDIDPGESKAVFAVGGVTGSDQELVEATDERSRTYREALRARCALIVTPTRAPW